MSDARDQTVFIVDDDAAVRDSVAELVESVGLTCEAYETPSAFLQAFRPGRAGCLVLDIRLPEMSGLALQQRLNEAGIAIPVIVITGHGDVPMAVQAMKAGAVEFLQKPYRDQALLDSINAALAMDAATRLSRTAADEYERCRATLTERELEVLDHLLAGRSTKEIAQILAISPRTAEAHRHNLLQKFDVGSAKALMHMAASAAARQ